MIIQSVAQIIDGRPLPRIDIGATVRDASHVLTDFNVGALVVMERDTLRGVLSERDIIRKCICLNKLTADTCVSEIMTADPVTIGPDTPLAKALGLMLDGRFRHLPVVRDGQTIGLLSIRDIPTQYRLMVERYNEYLGGPCAA